MFIQRFGSLRQTAQEPVPGIIAENFFHGVFDRFRLTVQVCRTFGISFVFMELPRSAQCFGKVQIIDGLRLTVQLAEFALPLAEIPDFLAFAGTAKFRKTGNAIRQCGIQNPVDLFLPADKQTVRPAEQNMFINSSDPRHGKNWNRQCQTSRRGQAQIPFAVEIAAQQVKRCCGEIIIAPDIIPEQHLITGIIGVQSLLAPWTIFIMLMHTEFQRVDRQLIMTDNRRIFTLKIRSFRQWQFQRNHPQIMQSNPAFRAMGHVHFQIARPQTPMTEREAVQTFMANITIRKTASVNVRAHPPVIQMFTMRNVQHHPVRISFECKSQISFRLCAQIRYDKITVRTGKLAQWFENKRLLIAKVFFTDDISLIGSGVGIGGKQFLNPVWCGKVAHTVQRRTFLFLSAFDDAAAAQTGFRKRKFFELRNFTQFERSADRSCNGLSWRKTILLAGIIFEYKSQLRSSPAFQLGTVRR